MATNRLLTWDGGQYFIQIWLKPHLKSIPDSISKSFVSRREAAGSAVARQGEATTTRMI
jgi:hypothetical protein